MPWPLEHLSCWPGICVSLWGAKYLADQRLNGFNIKGGLPPEVQAVLSGEMIGMTAAAVVPAQRACRSRRGAGPISTLA